jgi:DNA-directed RNA polymerase subunit RPC12/RpoP
MGTMTEYICQGCGHSKTITDGRLRGRDKEKIWCPRCVAKQPHDKKLPGSEQEARR